MMSQIGVTMIEESIHLAGVFEWVEVLQILLVPYKGEDYIVGNCFFICYPLYEQTTYTPFQKLHAHTCLCSEGCKEHDINETRCLYFVKTQNHDSGSMNGSRRGLFAIGPDSFLDFFSDSVSLI